MLEHESLQGISSMKPTGFRKRSNSFYEESETYTISSILQHLTVFHSTMNHHGLDQGLIKQVIKQLFYLVAAITLNNIMLRKDMCSCRKGMQIRSVLADQVCALNTTQREFSLTAAFSFQMQHQLSRRVAEREGTSKRECYGYFEATGSNCVVTASQQIHWWWCQRDHWKMLWTQPRSGTSICCLKCGFGGGFFFSFLNLALNSNLTLKFVDCQNFELVHAHWRFWKKSDIIVCPQSSGEPSCSFSNIKTLLAKINTVD